MEKKKIKDEIPGSIEKCQEAVKEIFQSSSDIVIDTFETIKGMAMLVYVDGLIDKNLVDRDIIAPLKSINFEGDISAAIRCTIADVDNMSSVTGQVLQGNTAVFSRAEKRSQLRT